jgi:hypothetical protein
LPLQHHTVSAFIKTSKKIQLLQRYGIPFLSVGFNYYVDPSSKASNIELGTKAFPFKSIDDPFREIFNSGLASVGGAVSALITVNLKIGSNLTVFSGKMPILVLNSNMLI